MDFVLAANANNPYRTHNSPQPRPISVPVDPSVLTLARRILAACWVHVTYGPDSFQWMGLGMLTALEIAGAAAALLMEGHDVRDLDISTLGNKR